MAPPFLTVLTAPVPSERERLIRKARRVARRVVKPGVPLPATSPYPGHSSLVRSVVEGLRAIGADFNFNPGRLADLARVVYAPANEALRQAAALKRDGRIDYLVAGPVNALFVDESDGILQLPEIDRIIVAHEWALEFYRDAPALKAKSRVCPCGVDTDAVEAVGRRDRKETRRGVLEERRRGVLRAGRTDRAALRAGTAALAVAARRACDVQSRPTIGGSSISRRSASS